MKKIISLLLSVILVVSLFSSVFSITTHAAGEVDEITIGTAWEKSWDATSTAERYAYLKVDESGFYNLNITDKNQNGIFVFVFRDLDLLESDPLYYQTFFYNSEAFDKFTQTQFYLTKDHLYEFVYAYNLKDSAQSTEASISVLFESTEYNPKTLNVGTIEQLTLNHNAHDWMEFTTGIEGDYTAKLYQGAEYYMFIFEKATGEMVDKVYFGGTVLKRMRLKANTTYIALGVCLESTPRICRFALTKDAKSISKIGIALGSFVLNDGVDSETGEYLISNYSQFEYKVTYADGTTEQLRYYELISMGVVINDITYLGETVKQGDEYILKTGKQPFLINYMNGRTTKSYATIQSFYSYAPSTTVYNPYQEMFLSYYGYAEECEELFRIKPDQNNVYDIESYDVDYIDVKFTVFDKNNNLIPYNKGWKLEKDVEYCLRAKYSHSDDYPYDAIFYFKPTAAHKHNSSIKKLTKATMEDSGRVEYQCSACGYITSSTMIYRPHTFKLSTTSYTYNGKKKTPKVIVENYLGDTLKKDTDYTVTYASGRVNIGTYKVTIKFKGNYSGTKNLYFKIKPISASKCKFTLSTTDYSYNGAAKKPTVTIKDPSGKKVSTKYYTVTYASGRKKIGTYKVTVKMKGLYSGTKTLYFKINPKKTSVSSLTAGKKSLKVKIKKQSSQTSGYQIQYSTSKTFKAKYTKSKTLKGYNTTSVTLKSLKAKKTYYVRVRTYKTVNGKKYYSAWSSYKYKKTK